MFHQRLVRLSIAACLLLASGCSSWRAPKFSLDGLRDPRAVDVDSRLSGPDASLDFKAE